MTNAKYVMVSFSDGDARVYLKRVASKTTVRCWNRLKDLGETEDTAEIVAEGTDKERLIAMARLARHDYVAHFEQSYDAVANHELVDRTRKSVLFP